MKTIKVLRVQSTTRVHGQIRNSSVKNVILNSYIYHSHFLVRLCVLLCYEQGVHGCELLAITVIKKLLVLILYIVTAF